MAEATTTNASSTTPSSKNVWTVGSTVRVHLPGHAKITRRAVIATLDVPNQKATILWEDWYPKPLPSCHHNPENNVGNSSRFLISPHGAAATDPTGTASTSRFTTTSSSCFGGGIMMEEEDIEIEVPLDQLVPLLEFETEFMSSSSTTAPPDDDQKPLRLEKAQQALIWKDRGDQLLKLGDAAAALPYYEHALRMTHLKETIGCSILVQTKQGYIRIADVDCVDDDDGLTTVDVTWKDSDGEEATLSVKENLLTILEPHHDNLQERLLLNLTRCLIQIAEVASSSRHRVAYAKAAVLATTMAHVLAELFGRGGGDATTTTNDSRNDDRVVTALLLRAQAQATLSKFAHAVQDLQRLLQMRPHHKQATQMLRHVQQKQKETQKRERTLVKEVCKWVETSTAGPVAADQQQRTTRRGKYDKDDVTIEETTSSKAASSKSMWSYFTCSSLE